jgi:mRNA interferase MazF
MDMVVRRFEVWLINLDPTVGKEVKKTRPGLVLSQDVVNKYLGTITIVPLTSALRSYPTRVHCQFQGRPGQVMIDQIRSLDKSRFIKKLGEMDASTAENICDAVAAIFKY